MQTTKDLSKTRKFFYRWINRLAVITGITLMVGVVITVFVRVGPDLMSLFATPRIEARTSMIWLISLYVAVVIYYELYLYGAVKRALARIKLYTVE